MTDSTVTECLLFPEIFAKPIRMEFDQRQGSSDGGAVLLKAAERRLGLISSMADCLFDPRQAAKVDHPLKDLFAQRVFSIACGYPDASDSARLAADPIHKMLLDRDPVVGLDLASYPTDEDLSVGAPRSRRSRVLKTPWAPSNSIVWASRWPRA